MINRKATAVWKGTGKEGAGTISTQSTVLENTQYSFNTRFAEGKGTNPEELIAAAHAGCFAMKLSFELNAEGFTADELNATATVSLDPSKGQVVKSAIELKASVPDISAEQFATIAEKAKKECPISQLLNAEITLNAELV
ncbi:Peroxiredoxin OsmC [Dyadobacter sp. CECT 9623]|jgi:osmotically inducible protein OsmC|uniref:Peroxiredoxin OsmC n=1 Tax=Dyadobacter linearis TaxID=2823330 RepID=A0ABN7RFC9_9BACT|nr:MULTISPECIES: OsmC family protein [unclassified Dyadobacter]MCE7059620.1 OsmC family protein [Dyadobacter sp. CY343]CAG5072105.1 Peroxiredoxin OsmC [Dyadobacter sp. CECT 9623]